MRPWVEYFYQGGSCKIYVIIKSLMTGFSWFAVTDQFILKTANVSITQVPLPSHIT